MVACIRAHIYHCVIQELILIIQTGIKQPVFISVTVTKESRHIKLMPQKLLYLYH